MRGWPLRPAVGMQGAGPLLAMKKKFCVKAWPLRVKGMEEDSKHVNTY